MCTVGSKCLPSHVRSFLMWFILLTIKNIKKRTFQLFKLQIGVFLLVVLRYYILQYNTVVLLLLYRIYLQNRYCTVADLVRDFFTSDQTF